MKKTLLLLALIVLFSSCKAESRSGFILSPSSPAVQGMFGNKAGNIINWGLVAEYGDDIYYVNPKNNFSIYKMDKAGQKTKLNDDASHFINVVGGWIYYSNESDEMKMYRMRTDGSGRTAINTMRSQSIIVTDNRVYFINGNVYEGTCGSTYSMNTDGTDLHEITTDLCQDLNIIGDVIYFANWSDNGSLYRMKTDGSDKTKINEDMCLDINVIDGWVYYRNGADANNLYKMKTDGTKRKMLYKGSVYCLGVLDNYVYFCDWRKNDRYPGPMKRVSINGGNAEQLDPNGGCSDVNLINNWVYFYVLSEEDAIYRMHLDGSDRQEVD